MDVLENYKKAWDNQPEESKKLSKIEIYKLTQSQSSSIVKWIFIIGILEFVIVNSSYFFIDMEVAMDQYRKLGIYEIVYYSQFIVYIAIFYYLIQFYINYRNISIVDDTKSLMKKILKTRKTVRNYVLLNLSYMLFVLVVASIGAINTNELLDSPKKIMLFLLIMLVFGLLILGVIWLFYQLLYGILLNKLKRNYKELAKLEELN